MKVESTRSNQAQEVSQSKAAQKSAKAAAAEQVKSQSKPAAASTAQATGGANTEISAKGKEFARAKAVAANAPDVREAKIAELRQRIADGKYKVDANAVADKMVDEHLKMNMS